MAAWPNPASASPAPVDAGTLASFSRSERLDALGTRTAGLDPAEVRERLALYGPNVPGATRGSHPLVAFSRYFTHTLALLLWFAAGLAVAADARELAAAILLVVLLNGIFAFAQEQRAERVIARLLEHVAPSATVRRAGTVERIPASQLVPGDIVLLAAEDIVPADCALLEARSLSLDVSMLTGESAAVPRSPESVPASPRDRVLDLTPIAPSGSTVVTGTGTAVVFATGPASSVGSIAHLVGTIRRGESRLEQQVAELSRATAIIAVVAGAVALAVARITTSLDVVAGLTFATGVIVALVPEGLLPTLSVSLAIGARRMAVRGAAVRRLSSVEVVGSATVICTDKTGTLTRNQLAVSTFVAASDSPNDRERALACAAVCTDLQTGPGGMPAGDPLDLAIDGWAASQGFDSAGLRARLKRVAEVPFDSHRRFMSVVCDEGGKRTVYIKGAPEVVIAMAGEAGVSEECREALAREAGRGHRLLAFASGPEGRPPSVAGIVVVADPVRPEVPGAVRACHHAGVRIVMLTGDHPLTAAAVARDVGLENVGVVGGTELDRLSDADVLRVVAGDAVFARIDPEQKLRVVRLLQEAGDVVVVTGDGTNDAPALTAADVGVAMGLRGTDVAKQAADIVLADDNFATIVAAIEEGRAVKENIRRFVSYHFTSNVAELAPFVAYAFFPMPLPLAITQVLAVDLGTDLLPAMALGVEPPSPGLMQRKPEPPLRPLLTRALALRTFLLFGVVEASLGLAGYLGYWWVEAGWRPFEPLAGVSQSFERESATITFLAIVGGQVGALFACRDGSLGSRLSLRSNRLLRLGLVCELAATLALVLLPGLNRAFGMAAIGGPWLLCVPASACVFLLVDVCRRAFTSHSVPTPSPVTS